MEIPHFYSNKLKKDEFISHINRYGFAVVRNIIDDNRIEKLKKQLIYSIEIEASFHGTNNFKDYGMLLACPIYGGEFLSLIDHPLLIEPFNWILGDTCIIYVYTSSSMPPWKGNYASRIHVDRPHFIPGYTEALGCLILLDDFTEENGATWVLPESHNLPDPPSEELFYNNAIRIIAPKGSVFYFHLRLWHAGGINNSNQWRHSLGIGMVRPYIKQRIDLPRAMENIGKENISEYALQKLGFYSQPPTSLEEYYLPKEKRKYSQRSEWDVTK